MHENDNIATEATQQTVREKKLNNGKMALLIRVPANRLNDGDYVIELKSVPGNKILEQYYSFGIVRKFSEPANILLF